MPIRDVDDDDLSPRRKYDSWISFLAGVLVVSVLVGAYVLIGAPGLWAPTAPSAPVVQKK
jgi:hypothetical protein